MKQVIYFLLFTIMIISQGCSDCGECFTPPDPFNFEIVDSATKENLFTNGTYVPSQIEVINTNDNKHVEYSFISQENSNLIQINSIGWQTEIVDILLRIADKNIFSLHVDAESVHEDCCSFTRYHEIKIENCEFEFDSSLNLYRILVD